MSREAIDSGHQKWLDAMAENNAEALGLLVTEDVVLMPPHEQPVSGRQGAIDWFTGIVKQARTTAMNVSDREVTVVDDWGFERGSFIWKLVPAGGESQIEDRGSFLAIWRREPDGSWKVVRNIWNSTLPIG